jgi:hypothetical protein
MHGPTIKPSVHQLIGYVFGVVVTMGGLTIATGPTTGPITNVTTGPAGVDTVPLGPTTNGLGRIVPASKRTAIVLSAGIGSDPTPQPVTAKQRINLMHFISAFQKGK